MKKPANGWKLLGDKVHQSKEGKQERQDPETIGSIREERKGNLQDDAEGAGGWCLRRRAVQDSRKSAFRLQEDRGRERISQE